MKHVFYIHSHITYYVTLAIISKYKISSKDIFFIISRGYKNTSLETSRCIDFTEIHSDIDKIYIKDFYKTYRYIDKVDKTLTSKIRDQDFIVYLPLMRHKLMQIIATNKNCKTLNIIEEGVSAYASYFMNIKEKNPLKRIGKLIVNDFINIGRGRFYYVKPFDLRKFKKESNPIFYTITNKGFNGICYDVEKVEVVKEQDFNYLISNKNVLVLEGAVEQGNLKFKTFINAINILLEENYMEELFIKFHPAQIDANKNKILEICNRYVKKLVVIPNEIPFEQIAVNNTGLNVFGFTTSLLFYSKEFGCNIKSYEYLFLEDPLFKKFRQENNFNLNDLLN